MNGKTVVITGRTGGFGRAGAEEIAALRARTVIVGRSQDKLSAAVREIPVALAGYQADLSLTSEIRVLADRLARKPRTLGCNTPTGATVAQVPEPPPEAVTQLPEPRCRVSTGTQELCRVSVPVSRFGFGT
jgi:NAD(P)-dependent dehydrogenase (short-subunit alcohol dehydrogenase family)